MTTRRIISWAALMMAGAAPALAADSVTCNPLFVLSTVGNVYVNCGVGREELARIAAELNRQSKQNRITRAELQSRIAAMNEIEAGRDRRMAALEHDMAAMQEQNRSTIEMLTQLSQGHLVPGQRLVSGAAPSQQPATARRITVKTLWPSWYQIVDRYPELKDLFGQGPDALCMRCLTEADGSFHNCLVAGAEAEPKFANAARKMASLMRVYSPEGADIQGRAFVIPITFGVVRPSQNQAGFCSRFALADYRL